MLESRRKKDTNFEFSPSLIKILAILPSPTSSLICIIVLGHAEKQHPFFSDTCSFSLYSDVKRMWICLLNSASIPPFLSYWLDTRDVQLKLNSFWGLVKWDQFVTSSKYLMDPSSFKWMAIEFRCDRTLTHKHKFCDFTWADSKL